jgi:Ti-type conjugative transfer relaxase TraA
MIVFKGGRLSKSGKRTGLGKSFRGVVSYLTEGPRTRPNPDRVAWTDTRNLDTIDDPQAAAFLMRSCAEENPRVQLPVYHFGLSLAQGEHLEPEQWTAAIDRVLTRMGLAEHQAVLIAHRDTGQEHVHIVVNRVGEDRRAWDPKRDMVKAREAVRAIEIDLGLGRTGRTGGSQDLPPPDRSSGEYHEARRTGRPPLAEQVRLEAGTAFARATSWGNLEDRLALLGYRLERAERGSGVVVTDGSRRVSLSHVDRNWSGPKLAQRFGETFRAHRERNPEPPEVHPRAGQAVESLPGATLRERAAHLVERVGATRATWTQVDLERAAFFQPASKALVREALGAASTVELGKDGRGATRYTSRDYLQAEVRFFHSAARLAGRADLRLDPAAVARSLDRVPHLSEEQRAAVYHATTRADLAQVVGRAGAGKTTAARTIADAYRDQGYEVRGAALAGKAAEGLEREAAVPSRTLASLEWAWSQGRDRLHGGSVLLVDEAGMIDVRQLGRVLDHAEQRHAKVVLLGDPDQLKAIGAGDAYRGLLEQHESASIESIRRQAEPWQRAASEQLARGRVASALDAYEAAGRLHWTDTRHAAHTGLVARYMADRQAQPEAAQLIVAYRNADARELNEAVRAARTAAGELGPGVSVGGAEYAPGDRLVFLRNDHQGREVRNLDSSGAAVGVKNGTLGTVERVEASHFAVRLDDGRRVGFDPREYDTVAHGYAVTIHKSQGATVDRVYALADPMMNRNAAYVALTRHREGVHLFADRETFADRLQLDKALSRDSRKDLARDYAAADLERIAARLALRRDQSAALRGKVQTLQDDIGTHERAATAGRDLLDARAALEEAAGRVYRNPKEATRSLLSDPTAVERLSAGEAPAYGHLRGHTRFLLGDDAQRTAALRAVPGLWHALHLHRYAHDAAGHALQAASSLGTGIADLKGQLAGVVTTLRMMEKASRAPEHALELAVRQIGHSAARAALSLVPARLQLPVDLAIRAVERTLDLALGLGR